MRIHLIDPKTAKSLSRRLESSEFLLGSVGLFLLGDAVSWFISGRHHFAPILERVENLLIFAGSISTILYAILRSHKKLSKYLAWIMLLSILTGLVVKQCGSKNFDWGYVIIDLLVGGFVLYSVAVIFLKKRLSSGKQIIDQA